MTMVNRPVAECLLRIRNGGEFGNFVAWLKERSDQAKDDCMKQSGEALYRAQGRAQERHEFLKLIEDAPGLLARLMKDQK